MAAASATIRALRLEEYGLRWAHAGSCERFADDLQGRLETQAPGLAGRAETGITGLYLGSSSAHPGGGVQGACGSNAARAAVLHDRLHHLTPRLTPWRTR